MVPNRATPHIKQCGISEGNSVSSAVCPCNDSFCTVMMRRENLGFRFGTDQQVVNHLFFMDGLKLCGRSQEELRRLLEILRLFSKDIVMEFGFYKYAV